MKILSPRAKSNRPAENALFAQMHSYQQLLWSRWQALAPRDQLALSLLMVFLLLFVGGYGGYSIHQAAQSNKADYQQQVADYFWLRAQAANIDNSALNTANTDSMVALPPASRVSTLLNDSGINDAQVIATNDTVQLSFNHNSQAVVSAALSELQQQGLQLTQLTMQQDLITKQIAVQAAVAF